MYTCNVVLCTCVHTHTLLCCFRLCAEYPSLGGSSHIRSQRATTGAITLPPPSQATHLTSFDTAPSVLLPPTDTNTKSTNLPILGADIIAETFKDAKKEPQISTPTSGHSQRQFFGNESGHPPFRPQPPIEGPGTPPQFRPHHPNNRPGEFGLQDFRSPTGGGPSPFSWQRSDYNGPRARRPSYEEREQSRNPYVYRRPENEPPPPPVRDPRMMTGDPRRGGGRPQEWGQETTPTSGPPPGWQGGPPTRPGEERPPPRDMRGPPPPPPNRQDWPSGGHPPLYPDQGPPPNERRPPENHPQPSRPLLDPRAQPRENFQPGRNDPRSGQGDFNRPSPQQQPTGTPPSQDPRFPPGRQGQSYGMQEPPPPPGR